MASEQREALIGEPREQGCNRPIPGCQENFHPVVDAASPACQTPQRHRGSPLGRWHFIRSTPGPRAQRPCPDPLTQLEDGPLEDLGTEVTSTFTVSMPCLPSELHDHRVSVVNDI